MYFSDMNLPEFIIRALEKNMITEPTAVQQKAIPLIESGVDMIGKSRTGSGKTFAFGIPSITAVDAEEKFTQILVICPTRELAVQVTGELRKLTEFKEGLKVVSIVGGQAMERQITALKSGAKIVVGTPGRLNDHIRRRTLKLQNVKKVILDEADEMMDMGFKTEIETILSKANPYRQTIMFSATMPPAVRDIAKNYMRTPTYLEVDKGDANHGVAQYYVSVGLKDKDRTIVELYRKLKPVPAIIFCNTKRMVENLCKKLEAEGISAVKLHGDMPQSERKSIMEAVKAKSANLLVATDVAARGIDIENVEVVFNYDIPKEYEWYVHRIGRTGRAGKNGSAYSLVNTVYQYNQLKEIEKQTGNVIREYYATFSKAHADKTLKPTKKSADKKLKAKRERPAKHGGKPDFVKGKGKPAQKGKKREFKKPTKKNYSAIKTTAKKRNGKRG